MVQPTMKQPVITSRMKLSVVNKSYGIINKLIIDLRFGFIGYFLGSQGFE